MFYLSIIKILIFFLINNTGVSDNTYWTPSDSLIKSNPVVSEDNETYLRVEVLGPDEERKWHYVYKDIHKQDKRFICVSACMRLLEKTDSIGAGLSLNFLNKEGKRVDFIEERFTEPTDHFVPIKLCAKIPDSIETLRLSVFIHNQGKVELTEPVITFPDNTTFDNGTITTVNISRKALPNRLFGFGAEDDGWFYDENNKRGGVDKQAISIRQNRLKELKPHWVRTFIWFRDWNPSDDGETFTFDSNGVQSLCRTLEDYENLNTNINITCVGWGIKDRWEDTDKRVKSIMALLNYLIKAKGYKNIKYFTLTNEPNYFFHTKNNRFTKFVEFHLALEEAFKKDGLKLKIVGSDDAMGTDWYSACLNNKEYSQLIDLWASHFYWHYCTSYLAYELFKNRINILRENKQNKNKPFLVTEFGITDHRFKPPLINPFMQEYSGALHTFASMIDGINQGVSGFSIWCMHEVRYPGSQEPMRMGLWGYADKNWELYPVYEALKIFTNNTKRGDKVYPVVTSDPIYIKFTKIENKLFWANLDTKDRNIIINDKNKYKSVYIYTKTINKYNIEHKKIKIDDKQITLPAQSFGFIE